MIPIKYFDEIPVFTIDQITIYGLPDYYGYKRYHVIESPPILTTDYNFSLQSYGRPIHRYNRTQRFTSIIQNLMGQGKLPKEMIELLTIFLQPFDGWYECRSLLKVFNYKSYYNKITCILYKILGKKFISINYIQYSKILKDFKDFEYKFFKLKHSFNRSYFPNMRFIALKLIEKNNIPKNYEIPFTLTKRKYKELQDIWNILK